MESPDQSKHLDKLDRKNTDAYVIPEMNRRSQQELPNGRHPVPKIPKKRSHKLPEKYTESNKQTQHGHRHQTNQGKNYDMDG